MQREYAAGDTLVEAGAPADHVFLIARGQLTQIDTGPYGDDTVLGTLADGAYFGEQALLDPETIWEYTVRAATHCTVLALPLHAFQEVAERSEALREHVAAYASRPDTPSA